MTRKISPLLLSAEGHQTKFSRCALTSHNGHVQYNEQFLDDLLFENPDLLPLSEIDPACEFPVPICTELSTPAGPFDILFVTPKGKIIIVENKLWRNPEARRKVIGQILDYASALSNWTYEDLQREVSRRLGKKGNCLYEIIKSYAPDTDEAEFVDGVSLCLKQGSFILLICGDGIRQNTSNIAEFLDRNTTLDFNFGLIEIGIYENDANERLIIPQVLAKTETIKRQIIQLPPGVTIDEVVDEDAPSEPREETPREILLKQFWTELSETIEFDDASQLPPNPTTKGYVTLRMPHTNCWVAMYFYQQRGDMGVYLTFNRGTWGDDIYASLLELKPEIENQLPSGTVWKTEDGKHTVTFKRNILNIADPGEYAHSQTWFKENANIFVNVFRPNIKNILHEEK